MRADAIATSLGWFAALVATAGPSVTALEIAVAAAATTMCLTAIAGGYTGTLVAQRVLTHRVGLRAGLVVGGVVVAAALVRDSTVDVGPLVAGALAAVVAAQVGRLLVDRRDARRRRTGRVVERVVLVADEGEVDDLVQFVDAHRMSGWRTAGIVTCRAESFDRAASDGALEDDVVALVRRVCATAVLTTPSVLRDDVVFARLQALRARGVPVHVHAGLRGLDHRRIRVAPFGHDALLCLDGPRLQHFQRALKRAFDVVLAGSLLVVTAPVVAVACIAIKVDDGGPLLFRQRRVGRAGSTFSMPKLRTMRVDAERQLAALTALNERRGGPLFKIADDPRVTRVGRILRATSIDELPQLVSVLRGHMSLIGPRPALPAEVVTFDRRLATRHEVRPGLTGLWQVEERDNGSFEAYRRLDIFYVENWSLLLDLTILVHTVPAVLARASRALHRADRERPARPPVALAEENPAPSPQPAPDVEHVFAS